MGATAVLEKKKVIAPKLRFKGFNDAWKNSRLEPYIEMISGIPIKGEDLSEDKEGTPIFRGINITEGYIRHNSEIDRFYLKDTSTLSKFIVKEGDLVIGMDGSKVGRNVSLITRNDDGAILIQRVARLRAKTNAYLPFIYQHIISVKFQRYVDEVNTSSGIPHISAKQINDFSIHFPSLPEQQKIASFLSAVDEKIQLLTRKKELLEQYKKGVMQQLFSGTLRFKPALSGVEGDEKGKDYPEWEEKRLGELIDFVNGKGHEQFIDPKGKYIVVNSKFVSTSGESKKYCNEQISPLTKGDIVMVMSDVPNGKALAKCLLIDENNKHTLNQRICALKQKNSINQFLIFLINRNDYYLSFDSGVGQTNLKKDDVLNCPLFIPSSLEEQKKIADFLTVLNLKIKAIDNQIIETQTFKKGLLQQMFV